MKRDDRMGAVLRIREVQEDIAAATRQRAELAVAQEEARFNARQADVRRPWTDRALVELAFEAADRAKGSLATAETVADQHRLAHLEAVRAAKAIAKLVDRRRIEARREEARDQAAELDDLASIRHARALGATR